MLQHNKNLIFSHFCTIFVLTSYSLYTKVMLNLILIEVQNLQNVVSRFKGSNSQNHSSLEQVSITPPPKRNFTPRKISITHWGGGFPLHLKVNLENPVVCNSHYKLKMLQSICPIRKSLHYVGLHSTSNLLCKN